MSKFTKLVNSPDKFFKDFMIKRINSLDVGFKSENIERKILDDNVKEKIQKKIVEFDFNAIFFDNEINTIIHCGENSTVGFSIMQDWLNLLESHNNKFIILVRNHDFFNKLKTIYKDFNIAYAKSPTDVENLISKVKKLKNICFVSNTANNIHLIRFNEYKHIFIGNFDENRQPSLHKYFKAYDECWFYSKIKKELFEEVISSSHLDIKIINHPNYILKSENYFKNVTYWATGHNESFCSSLFFLKDLKNLDFFKDYYLNVYTDKNNKDVVNRFLQRYQVSSFTDSLLLRMSNVVIMDYNFNQTKEALLLGVPVIVYVPEDFENIFSEEDRMILELCYKFNNLETLDSLLRKIAVNDDLRVNRLKFIENNYGAVILENHNFKKTLNQLFMGAK